MPLPALLLPLILHGAPGRAPQVRSITLDDVISQSSSGVEEAPDHWTAQGESYLTVEGSAGRQEIVATSARSGRRRVIVPSDWLRRPDGSHIEVENFSLSADEHAALIFTHSKRVWRENTRGDYWALDLQTHELRKLGGDAAESSLMFAKFSPDGTRVGYVRENNIYVQDLRSGAITALTTDGAPTLIDGTFDWVYEEELSLRDGWRWSPDGTSIAYWQLDTSKEPLYTLIDDTDSLYPTIKQFPYPKAGETNATVRVGVVSASGGPTVWIGRPMTSDDGYIARMQWAPDSRNLLIQRLNRRQNELRFVLADARTGTEKAVTIDRDPAWVDVADTGPEGVSWCGGDRFLLLSERDGWRRLYVETIDGHAECLTPAKSDVESVLGYDSRSKTAYFTASPDNATQRYLYAVRLDGSKSGSFRLTPSGGAYAGTNEYVLSPDMAVAIHTHSAILTPPTREIVSLPDHARMRSLPLSSDASLKGLELGKTTFTQFKTADGQEMDGIVILPPHFDPSKKYPLFFEVYGEPAGLTVRDEWSPSTMMFDQFLAGRGYIVASVDNRGTPSLKGRGWRKSVYKKIGILASDDQAAAVRQMLARPYVDPARVGVWGWSGGGSMTLDLLFRYPRLYALGMAVAPVPDVSLYDSIYQERYMGLPKDDPEAYRRCSPITFAGQLRGDLLIVHGSGDDNVHFQGTERLIDALVAHDKPFELMVYPNRTHGLSEGEGTTRHLYELLVRFLTTHMPPGPR